MPNEPGRPGPKLKLAGLLLGQDLADWVAERRPDKTWEAIAAELAEAVDIDPPISDEWLRVQYRDLDSRAS